MRSHGELPLRFQVAIAVVSTALFLWFLPWLTAAIKRSSTPAEAVQTFALTVVCERRPLVILVSEREGRPIGECVYAAPAPYGTRPR